MTSTPQSTRFSRIAGADVGERDLDDLDVAARVEAVLLQRHAQHEVDRGAEGVDGDLLAFEVGDGLDRRVFEHEEACWWRSRGGRPGSCRR